MKMIKQPGTMRRGNTKIWAFLLASALFVTTGYSVGAELLPGSFPETGVLKGPYEKYITIDDLVGDWHIMANGRVYNASMSASGQQLSINGKGMGMISEVEWTKNGMLTFTRSISRANLIQRFTGYFMQYSYTNNNGGIPDYKRRIAGVLEQVSPVPLSVGNTSGWYATRPAGCSNGPNLVVGDTEVDFSAQTVSVEVKNTGDTDADAHLTYIEINEVGVDSSQTPQTQYSAEVSGIPKGASWSSGAIPFAAFSQPRGLDLSTLTSANLLVHADAKGMVEECNENDNTLDTNLH